MAKSLLIIDDDPALRVGLSESLTVAGYECEAVESLRTARARLTGSEPDCVLLDLQLGDGTGLDLLPELAAAWPETPVVMMTAHGSVRTAVEAMQAGASTYLQKPLDTDELLVVLRNVMEYGKLRRQTSDRRRRKQIRFGFEQVVSRSAGMKRVLEQSRAVAESPASTVLLLGESGTGKGLIARTIHYASRRAAEPLLTVTCSAIPEPLLEAELLGHEKGAFTDAKARRQGVFEAADGGTVFLDEIGDMPLTLQAKLLGVLEDRSFSRVGSTESIHVDVRIIAATHRDLDRSVAEGRFRDDLLYRLRVVPIVIPPLRERAADIKPLAGRFIERFNREFGRQVGGLSADALEHLKQHGWPGNVRELRNVIERAMLFARGDELGIDDLMLDPGYAPQSARPAGAAAPPTPAVARAREAGGEEFRIPASGINLEAFENDLVRQAMARAGGNKSRAAKILGISRDQIRYRLEKMEKNS